jgi:hypothetical protein
MPFWRLLLPLPRVPLENARIHSLKNIQDFTRDQKHLSFVAENSNFLRVRAGMEEKKTHLKKGADDGIESATTRCCSYI